MIELPDFDRSFDYENGFYLSCKPARIAKILAHYELFKMIREVPGAVVECGVFKGVSFTRFAAFRELMETESARPMIGFDIFGTFPPTEFEADQAQLDRFISGAGDQSIDVEQLREVLRKKGCDQRVDLVKGNILETVPEYVAKNPQMRIALLNLDTDVYEPAVTILEHLYPRIVPGGVLVLDDYGTFPGETKAVDDFFRGRGEKIQRFSFCETPCYIIKE